MESFVVSALKYRPKTFDEVVGQQAITQTLQNALNTNQLAQALLFCGPRGVGKTSCARILAKKINTYQNSDNDQDFAFNVFELDAASNNSVEDIRQLNERVRIPPQVGSHKIYIIDEAHMLSTAAFNAFLKTLEEPPKHVIFILATTEKNKIIPTILSRCQVYDFKRVTIEDIQKHLAKIAALRDLKFEDKALYLIAKKADGAMRDALSTFDKMANFTDGNLTTTAVAENLNILDHETYFELTKKIVRRDIPALLLKYDVLLRRGFDGAQLLSGLATHFRNLLLCKDTETFSLMEVSVSAQKVFQEQTTELNHKWLLDALSLINSFELNLKNSKNRRLHVELCLMQLASLHFDEKKKEGFIIPTRHFKSDSPARTVVKKESQKDYSEKEKQQQASISPSIIEEELPQKNKKDTPVSGFSLFSVSLKRSIQNNKNAAAVKPEELPHDDFTEECLIEVWKAYAEQKIKKGESNIAAILQMDAPKLKENFIVSFVVANALNKVELLKEKEFLMPYIKNKLNNYKIELDIHVAKSIETKYAFSSREKYDLLLKINPELEYLRKTFDLNY